MARRKLKTFVADQGVFDVFEAMSGLLSNAEGAHVPERHIFLDALRAYMIDRTFRDAPRRLKQQLAKIKATTEPDKREAAITEARADYERAWRRLVAACDEHGYAFDERYREVRF